ncbi:MAG: PilZ domain-containing protein [Desulfosalsimonadaceae bacterium]
MEKVNQREEKRYDAIHLLNYICLDSENRQLGQGMARTLNLSETGVKIETHQPIETRDIVFLAIGIGEDIFDIKGKVVYCNRGPEGRFESGVEFYELDFESFGKLKRFIKALEEKMA